MSGETQEIVELLDQRLAAMNEVAESLASAGAAIAACDIDALETRIKEQEKLCQRIRDLDGHLEGLRVRQCSRDANTSADGLGVNAADQQQLKQAMIRLQEVHQRVKRLNANHAELLRRSRRTVNALTQAYQSVSLETYADPMPRAVSAGERV